MEVECATVRQIAAEAHWQLGRVLARIIDEQSPSNREEWEECVRHAHIKNAMIQSYGYTPHQHVFGRTLAYREICSVNPCILYQPLLPCKKWLMTQKYWNGTLSKKRMQFVFT